MHSPESYLIPSPKIQRGRDQEGQLDRPGVTRIDARHTSMPNLDLLRSIAVLLVVVEHTLLAMRLHWIGSWDIAWLGVVGVFFFFVHTSLVLMWSMERKPHILDFYVRRVFRIYPLAVATLLATVLFHLPSMQNIAGDTYFKYENFRNLVANLLLIQNLGWGGNLLGVMWSLPLEVDMYFLLPFLFFFIQRNFVVWPMLGLWIVAAAYARSAFPPESNSFAVCIPYFLSGAIAYLLYAKVQPRLPGWLLPPIAGVLLVLFMAAPSWRHGWWVTLALGISLPHLRPIRARWLIRSSHLVAKYSYGIYLVHPFCIAIGVNLLHGYPWPIRIAAIVLSIAAVVIPAYHFLEKPMIDLGAKQAARLEGRYEAAEPAK